MSKITDPVEAFAFALYCRDFEGDEEMENFKPGVLVSLKINWLEYMMPSLQGPHTGDCVKQCMTCLRCATEGYFQTAKNFLEP